MLISPAYAQTGGGAGFDIMALAPLVLIFVVFYFLLIRPQQKKMKQHREMLSAVRRGDRVVVGGIVGTVAKVVSDTELNIEIADGVRVRVVRSAVAEVLSKTEPVKAEGGGKAAEDKPASGG
ncbi:MAG: preprotein translocase subunit YajC [Alphaproteobacteria bacterium]|nr:preprotein translocase subunit YajC [Alphaproteobacteria bacterium]